MPQPPLPADPAPDVSVILPVRDGARFVAEAVASVRGQVSPARCEIIAVDGAIVIGVRQGAVARLTSPRAKAETEK